MERFEKVVLGGEGGGRRVRSEPVRQDTSTRVQYGVRRAYRLSLALDKDATAPAAIAICSCFHCWARCSAGWRASGMERAEKHEGVEGASGRSFARN